MANNKYKFFILTGDPGVGKTTLVKKISTLLSEKGVKTSGFYTEEVRKNGIREGFDIVSLNGVRGRLARDLSLLSGPVEYKVSKYGVLRQEFECVALGALKMPEDTKANLLIIDEIGKMEFCSKLFKDRIREIFRPSSNCVVLATIPVRKSDPIIENIRYNSQAKVWTVTRVNRTSLHEDIMTEMKNTLNFT